MTLNEYCTGIADAIREVEGSTEAIPAPDHAARIKALTGCSEYIAVGMTSSYFRYIDENGVVQTGSPNTPIVKAYRGVVFSETTMVIATGDYVKIGSYVYIFKSDGGTIKFD